MNAVDLSPIHAEVLDPTTKGDPLSAAPLPLSAIGAQGWSVLAGDLPLPLAVLRDKWRVLFTVDNRYRVTGAIRTFF